MRALLLAACGASFGHARPAHEPLAPIAVAQSVAGDTHDDDGWHAAICNGGGTVGVTSARAYRFVPPATASYRIDVTASYDAVVEISDADNPRYDGTVACFRIRRAAGVTVAMRAGGHYDLVVDGHMQARGSYTVAIARDDGAGAPVRPEDPAIAGHVLAAAPAIAVGGEAAGTFHSLPGGSRASCGGTGGDAAYRLAVPSGGVHVEVAAQFPAVVELRDRTGAVIACRAGEYDVRVDAPAGDYVVVIDTSEVIDEPGDRRGAGVLGAYWLRAEATP